MIESPIKGTTGLAFAVIAALVAIATAGSVGAAEPVRIALLPVVVHSSENPVYLREGLADMLSARLHGVESVEILRVDDVEKATSRLSRALASARDLEADYVVFGSFTRFGEGASLDIQCAATDREGSEGLLREIFVHSSSMGEVIPDLDDLVGKITRFIDRQPAAPAEGLPASPAPSGLATGPTLQELVDRIQALEESVRELQSSGSPAEVSLR